MFENAIKVLRARADMDAIHRPLVPQYPLFTAVQVDRACACAANFLQFVEEHNNSAGAWEEDIFNNDTLRDIVIWGVLCSSSDIPPEELTRAIALLQGVK